MPRPPFGAEPPGGRSVKKTLAALLCAASVVALEAAKIKVKAEPDPTYDFSTVRTWAWDAEGDVIMARTPTDDPVALKARLDPLIRKYVACLLYTSDAADERSS